MTLGQIGRLGFCFRAGTLAGAYLSHCHRPLGMGNVELHARQGLHRHDMHTLGPKQPPPPRRAPVVQDGRSNARRGTCRFPLPTFLILLLPFIGTSAGIPSAVFPSPSDEVRRRHPTTHQPARWVGLSPTPRGGLARVCSPRFHDARTSVTPPRPAVPAGPRP